MVVYSFPNRHTNVGDFWRLEELFFDKSKGLNSITHVARSGEVFSGRGLLRLWQ